MYGTLQKECWLRQSVVMAGPSVRHQSTTAALDRVGIPPLRIFLTTTSRIDASAGGILGPVWHSAATPWADNPMRVCWLPRLGRQDATVQDRGASGQRSPTSNSSLSKSLQRSARTTSSMKEIGTD